MFCRTFQEQKHAIPLFLDIFPSDEYNRHMELYRVKRLPPHSDFTVEVPASKSILNRALILAAFGNGETLLSCGDFAEDTRAMLSCLTALGIRWREEDGGIRVFGCGGKIPVRNAELNVRSAGTAARFLTAALAFLGGDYTMRSSAQMEKRPMELLSALETSGAVIEYLGERGHFPFRLHSDGIKAAMLSVDTDLSTQYASGILLAAAVSRPTALRLTGSRTDGSYINMTLRLMERFGAAWTREGNIIRVVPAEHSPESIEIESDLSGACYFYALSLLLSARVLVRRIHPDTLQGDKKFLALLSARGVRFEDTAEGLLADGSSVFDYRGFTENMGNFSDQALTVAALAPFADTPTRITGIGHIRRQECNRIRAITENLSALGVPVTEEADGVTIEPAPVHSGTIRTFGDHRVAMAFSLIGLKTGEISIEDPQCCKKTFENYFDILERLTQ